VLKLARNIADMAGCGEDWTEPSGRGAAVSTTDE
jgi:hypothetical protein